LPAPAMTTTWLLNNNPVSDMFGLECATDSEHKTIEFCIKTTDFFFLSCRKNLCRVALAEVSHVAYRAKGPNLSTEGDLIAYLSDFTSHVSYVLKAF
jgi:hypothetical protein